MASVIDEHQVWEGTNGKPIVNGSIFIGVQNQDPILNPITIYSDRDLTVTIANPQTTDSFGRSTNKIWIPGKYSIIVQDSASVQKYSELDAGESPATGITNLTNVAGANTITADASPTITLLVDKEIYPFTAIGTNTGAVTLAIDLVAAKAVLKYHDQPLIAGDIEINQAVSVMYNGTDDTFELISSTLDPQIQSITATVAASALTLGLNPTSQYFRSTPLTDGTPNVRSNAAISLVVPSGATLGTTNAVESKLILIAIDNGGTIELAVNNSTVAGTLDETGLITTIAIDATADSADVFYSTTARTSLPYRVVGFIESTQATAGTWATSPTVIQGMGGQSLLDFINELELQTEIATTSGTEHDFTGIPSWVKKITVMLDGVSTDGTSQLMTQIGPTGGIETTSYTGVVEAAAGRTATSTGFILQHTNLAIALVKGVVTLYLMDSATNKWAVSGLIDNNDAVQGLAYSTGIKSLAGALTQIRLTTIGGSDTFDAGTFNIMWE